MPDAPAASSKKKSCAEIVALSDRTTADDLAHFFLDADRHGRPARCSPRTTTTKGKTMKNYYILEISDEDENLIPRVIEYIAIDTWGQQ